MDKCRTKGFSTSGVSAEIKISISSGHDEENLFHELKKCVQNWNRRAEKHGGSRIEYCVELTKANAASHEKRS